MECHPSKWKLLGLFGLTCVMVAVCYYCTTLPNLKALIAGWLGLALFSVGLVGFPIAFFRKGAQVVINDEGIEDRRLKLGVIPWEDIDSLSLGKMKSTRFLCVWLVEPERYLARMSRWQRMMAIANEKLGFSAITISFSGLSPGINQAWAYLQERNKAPEVWPSSGVRMDGTTLE